jgi:hypothetical protein
MEVVFSPNRGVLGFEPKNWRVSDPNGKDERTHIKSKYANRLVPSPDNQWIVLTHFCTKPKHSSIKHHNGKIDLGRKTSKCSSFELSKEAGITPLVTKQQNVMWMLGRQLFSNAIKPIYFFTEFTRKSWKPSRWYQNRFKIKVDKPKGRFAFTNVWSSRWMATKWSMAVTLSMEIELSHW